MRARSEGEQALTIWLRAVDKAIDKLTATLPAVAQGSFPPNEAQPLAAGLLELLSSGQDMGDARRAAKTDAASRVLALAASGGQRAKFPQALPAPSAADGATEKRTIEQ